MSEVNFDFLDTGVDRFILLLLGDVRDFFELDLTGSEGDRPAPEFT